MERKLEEIKRFGMHPVVVDAPQDAVTFDKVTGPLGLILPANRQRINVSGVLDNYTELIVLW